METNIVSQNQSNGEVTFQDFSEIKSSRPLVQTVDRYFVKEQAHPGFLGINMSRVQLSKLVKRSTDFYLNEHAHSGPDFLSTNRSILSPYKNIHLPLDISYKRINSY